MQYHTSNPLINYFKPLPLYIFLGILLSLFAGCGDKEKKIDAVLLKPFTPRDSSLCKLEEAGIKEFAAKYNLKDSLPLKIIDFYMHRSFKTAWTHNHGVNEYAGNFVNLLHNEMRVNGSKSPVHLDVLESLYSTMVSDNTFRCGDSLLHDLEIMLTVNFFDYARRNWGGMSDELSKSAGWFIVRKQMDYHQLLNDFLTAQDKVNAREPVYRQYGLLKKYLEKYAMLEKEKKIPALPPGELPVLKQGDTSSFVGTIKKFLRLTDDFAGDDTDAYFDEHLTASLKSFQERHGINPDGQLNRETVKAMRVPVHERAEQIIINMERSRWVPTDVKGDDVVVNIPEYKMHVYEGDKLSWSSNVIVGKSNPVNKTVIFNDSLEMIVFSPHWNIPLNILTREILPEIRKNKKYLKKTNLEVVDRKGNPVDPDDIDWERYKERFPYFLRERPGENNSLGLVKFLFPNAYDIYIHDTPAKALFSKTSRPFSHGCIRLQEPERFAQHLLRDDPSWPPEKIAETMRGGTETFVKLKKKVPVFIAYFTAWVDREGRLNFAEDIYEHDQNMKRLLFAATDNAAAEHDTLSH